jgi:hypothetical protein
MAFVLSYRSSSPLRLTQDQGAPRRWPRRRPAPRAPGSRSARIVMRDHTSRTAVVASSVRADILADDQPDTPPYLHVIVVLVDVAAEDARDLPGHACQAARHRLRVCLEFSGPIFRELEWKRWSRAAHLVPAAAAPRARGRQEPHLGSGRIVASEAPNMLGDIV